MGRFTQKAADRSYSGWMWQMLWDRLTGTFYITDLRTRDQQRRCHELSGAGGSKREGSVRQVVRLPA